VLLGVAVAAGVFVGVTSGGAVLHDGPSGQEGVAVTGGAGVSAHGGDDGLLQSMGMGVTVTQGGDVGRPVGMQSGSKGIVVATAQGGEVLPPGSHSPGSGTMVYGTHSSIAPLLSFPTQNWWRPRLLASAGGVTTPLALSVAHSSGTLPSVSSSHVSARSALGQSPSPGSRFSLYVY
jgi:hypothetical protein